MTQELEGLQDAVPAGGLRRDPRARRARARHAAGARPTPTSSRTPVAAASLGQVHRARLTPEAAAETGFTDVVVKIQRPGIGTIVEIDLAALQRVARRLSRVKLV